MKQFLLKNKNTIIITLIVIAIILFIYFYGKKAGKTQSTTTDLPKDTAWGDTLTTAESEKIKTLAARLYKEMKGITWISDNSLWDEYFYSTDRVFIGVFNYFNQKYQAEGDGTLYDWVNDEVASDNIFYKSSFAVYKNSILKRMSNLGLV